MSVRLRIAALVCAGVLALGAPALASAGPLHRCTAGVPQARSTPCGDAKRPRSLITVGEKLATGDVSGAVGAAASTAAGAAAGAVGSSVMAVGLTFVEGWVLGSAKFALDETAKVLGSTTSPELQSTWFSGTYWRMAGISAVLTLPFLFAAAVQALLRSDLALLARAALMHLPLAMLVVSIAAPLTMLLLAASDELSAIVSGAAGNESAHFLANAALAAGDLSLAASPFLAFLIGVFTVAGAVVLWIELLMREAAVYVIVLMLPLAFAAFVWPARRIWAVRTLELLGALILSKFAIVAVLSLGGAALNSSLGHPSVGNWLAGLVLVLMAAFMPWALLRLVPLAEVASGAVGSFRHELQREVLDGAKGADMVAGHGQDWLASIAGRMRRQAHEVAEARRGGGTGRAERGRDQTPEPDRSTEPPAPAPEDGEEQPPGEAPATENPPAPVSAPADGQDPVPPDRPGAAPASAQGRGAGERRWRGAGGRRWRGAGGRGWRGAGGRPGPAASGRRRARP